MTEPADWPAIYRRSAVVLLSIVLLMAAALFLSYGGLFWLNGWVMLGLWVGCMTINLVILSAANPVVIQRRANSPKASYAFDRLFFKVYMPAALAIYVVAGIETGRLGLSLVPWPLIVSGTVVFISGELLSIFSMVHNEFFEPTVRIQQDHDHHVISTGPYSWVRHPGYLAGIMLCFGAPLLLGSALGLIPAGIVIGSFIYRTMHEDRILAKGLPGYTDYQEKTRYRLFPGIW